MGFRIGGGLGPFGGSIGNRGVSFRAGPVWGASSYPRLHRYRGARRPVEGADDALGALILVVVALPLIALLTALVLAIVAAVVTLAFASVVYGLMMFWPFGPGLLIEHHQRRLFKRLESVDLAVRIAWGAQVLWGIYLLYASVRESTWTFVISAMLLVGCCYLGGLIARPKDRERDGREFGLTLGVAGLMLATRLGPSDSLRAHQSAIGEQHRLAAKAAAQHEAAALAAAQQRQNQIELWWFAQPPPVEASKHRPCPRCAETVLPAAIQCWRCRNTLTPHATWAADPSGQYASRYWNHGWTPLVANIHGQHGNDPLGPGVPISPTVQQ